jgi:hypothetical protein
MGEKSGYNLSIFKLFGKGKNMEQDREHRYPSHILMEIRRHKLWPFQSESAVLLDLSSKGFKAALVGQMIPKVDQTYWLTIPFAPFGLAPQGGVSCLISCVWWDSKERKMGGIFLDLSLEERHYLDRMIDVLDEFHSDQR